MKGTLKNGRPWRMDEVNSKGRPTGKFHLSFEANNGSSLDIKQEFTEEEATGFLAVLNHICSPLSDAFKLHLMNRR